MKRQMEEELAAELIMDSDVEVSLVPHVYDMGADHTGMLFLRSVPGDVVLLSWLYPRAVRWVLDRQGVKGQFGVTILKHEGQDDDEPPPESVESENAIGPVDVPNRKLYVIDLRAYDDPQVYLEEIRRIANDTQVQTVDLMSFIQGNPKQEQMQRYLQPLDILNPNANGNGQPANGEAGSPEPTKRRWYPVIDYDRCTNCMECIDFCLFGVYGVDKLDRILVEEQDNCKKGCPACSRVCPENAIIFPGHKDSAIAGADGEVGNLKIDLSKLFGGDSDKTPLELAVAERDTELVGDGREAVGMTVGIPKRQTDAEQKPRDDLDDLMDGLDSLDF